MPRKNRTASYCALLAIVGAVCTTAVAAKKKQTPAPTPQKNTASPTAYQDGRPQAVKRLNAQDQGVVLKHGDGPKQCDTLGARDVWCWEYEGTYYMHYDAAGPTGWLCSLATSRDLLKWEKKGPILDLGKPGELDSASASYGVTFFDGHVWQMFYLGTPNVTPPPDRIPSFPYVTMKAKANSPGGPWTKQPDVVPFRPKEGTYYSATASPGDIVRTADGFLQFFSASTFDGKLTRRTIGIARTKRNFPRLK